METKLLDSAHGWEDPSNYFLEQYWGVVDDDGLEADIVRVSVQYSPLGYEYSSAELLVLEQELVNEKSMVRLRAFSGEWWKEIHPLANSESAPELLEQVAGDLLARFVTMKEAAES